MKKCLIIINDSAGGSKRISFGQVERCLGNSYEYSRAELPHDDIDCEGYDAVAICGGDGTLSTIMQRIWTKPIEVYYFAAGTLNDKAKAERYSASARECVSCDDGSVTGQPVAVGIANGKLFTYVLAAGTFTPIGYTTKVGLKKKFGCLAYVSQILKEYKVHRIYAALEADGMKYSDTFTLIMFLKSPRCFGFRFNKAFDEKSDTGHLVAIRSPKHDGILGKIEIFFPFFRVFFIGLKKQSAEGSVLFVPFKSCEVTLDRETVFCQDGEKQTYKKKICVGFEHTVCNFSVINKL